MAETLVLKTNQEPSFLNKDTFIGALIGSYFTPVAGTLIGAAIGGYLGKNRQEKENIDGKAVGTPSKWNKDTLLGGLLGNQIGLYLGLAAVAVITYAGAASLGIPTATPLSEITESLLQKAPEYIAAAGATFLGTWAAGTAIGAYFGAQHGENRMAREYADAQQQQISQKTALSRSQTIEHSAEPDLANEKSWRQEIMNERQRAAEQRTVG